MVNPGASWVVGFGGSRTATNVTSPAGMTNRKLSGTTDMIAAGDTNAAVSSWAATTVTVNTTTQNIGVVVELFANNCNSTLYSPFTCVSSKTASGASDPLTNVYAGGYLAGQTIIAQAYKNDAAAYTSGMLSNTAGYAWTFFGTCQSAGATRSMAVWYFNVSSTNGSSDTITLNATYSGGFEVLNTEVISGLGAIDGAGIVCAKGTSGTPASGNYTVTVGDLLIGMAQASATTTATGSGWTSRVQDAFSASSPQVGVEDSIAASTTASATFANADTDWLVQALAFKIPSTGGCVSRIALLGTGQC